ncbi:MAG: glutamyl-tRNA amidotransferase [Lachnospiraceae bacterium]|nr:glutamyl-tRNA amidotransferase [Lachnospiraceae bacterium]
MILVDISVPSVDKVYDFQLSETAQIGVVIEEIAEIIGQKERTEIVGDVSMLQLCDKNAQIVLPRNRTFSDCNIHTGDSLILI